MAHKCLRVLLSSTRSDFPHGAGRVAGDASWRLQPLSRHDEGRRALRGEKVVREAGVEVQMSFVISVPRGCRSPPGRPVLQVHTRLLS